MTYRPKLALPFLLPEEVVFWMVKAEEDDDDMAWKREVREWARVEPLGFEPRCRGVLVIARIRADRNRTDSEGDRWPRSGSRTSRRLERRGLRSNSTMWEFYQKLRDEESNWGVRLRAGTWN